MFRAGEFAIRHGPWALPAVCAANAVLKRKVKSAMKWARRASEGSGLASSVSVP